MGAHTCQARQYGDQMICHRCRLNWDVNDPEPPECQKAVDRRTREARATEGLEAAMQHAQERRDLPDPDKVPEHIYYSMARAYRANLVPAGDTAHFGHAKAMRAAYRVLLDSLGV